MRKITRATTTKKDIPRLALFGLCELFSAGSLIYFIMLGDTSSIALAALTLFLVALPEAIERILGCRVNTAVYLFGLFYAIGPMLGHAYQLYHLLPGFDKLLHTCGGVAFALLGAYLPLLRRQDYKRDLLARAAFALCFSIAISVVWEFYEFGSDRLTGSDMQQDTIVTSVSSYLFGDAPGEIGRIDGIEQVTINGKPLAYSGYIDIGLTDTMTDMLSETLGALAYVVILLLDRDRHPAFMRKQK